MKDKDGLFPGDGDFSKLVKKAQRKSLIRNIVVSVIVSSLLFAGLFWLGTFLMYKNMEDELSYDYAKQSIRGANVELKGTLYNYTPFSAHAVTSSFKSVAGVPLAWESYEKEFSIFGTSRPVVSDSVNGIGTIKDERIVLYFMGERVIEFYSPEIDYQFLPANQALLQEIDGNKVVEMAFSFDAAYGIEEVEEIFSEQLNWYWVDAVTPGEKEAGQTISAGNAYGFLQNRDGIESAEGFLHQIEWLRDEKGDFQGEADRIYDNIAGNSSSEINVDDLKVSGVVVTGSPEDLLALSNLPMIRAAVLGATADKY